MERDDKGAGKEEKEDTFLLDLNVHLGIPFYSHSKFNSEIKDLFSVPSQRVPVYPGLQTQW